MAEHVGLLDVWYLGLLRQGFAAKDTVRRVNMVNSSIQYGLPIL